MNVVVKKLDNPVHDGDWHDPLLVYGVFGPGNEFQRFTTKKRAELYKKIRKSSTSFNEASWKYINS